MSPRHSLALLVSIVAVIVAALWFLLFRSHVLAPPVTMPVGPTLPEIGRQFEEQAASLNKLIAPPPTVNAAPTNTPPVSASSDDVRTPAPAAESVPPTP